MFPPNDEKQPRVAVRDQILGHLAAQSALRSKGGQFHMLLDTPGSHNSFAVPFDSPFLHAWVTRRQQRLGPPPTEAQMRQALAVKRAVCLIGSQTEYCKPINLRYAWDPDHRIPEPQVDEQGNAFRDYANTPGQPAYVMALDARQGRHVSITAKGWFIQPSQALFIHDPIQHNIADPVAPIDHPEDTLTPFRQLLRLDEPRHDEAWQSLLDWTLNAMRAPRDPAFHHYPILNLVGPENSGKSVTAKLLTQLLDPTMTPIHSLPSTERRLHGLAANHHILTFDDTGKINLEKSRYLSRLASGVSSLHKNLEGMAVRPIILTTNEEPETKHLADKVVDVELPPIEDPLPQSEIQSQFEAMRPQILGALLTILAFEFNMPAPFLPNRRTKNQKIEQCVTEFLKSQGGTWQGTATELANLVRQPLGCPISAKAISQAVDEMPSLIVTRPKRKNNHRPIHLQLIPTLSEPQDLLPNDQT